jgi:hypothetical protein
VASFGFCDGVAGELRGADLLRTEDYNILSEPDFLDPKNLFVFRVKLVSAFG